MTIKSNQTNPKLFSVVGRSGSGKTTLITHLIPLFVNKGITVGSIKHTHHNVELDKPGKDSWKHSQAGSSQVLLLTHGKMALYGSYDPVSSLKELSLRWFSNFDLVISEGFKNEQCLKIEITRKENRKPPLFDDPSYNIQAVVSDYNVQTELPRFQLNQYNELFQWLCQKLAI